MVMPNNNTENSDNEHDSVGGGASSSSTGGASSSTGGASSSTGGDGSVSAGGDGSVSAGGTGSVSTGGTGSVSATIVEPGLEIITTNDNNGYHIQFTSTQPDIYDPNINEDLVEVVRVYDDTNAGGPNAEIVSQIKTYASKIQCTDFHGKGTIDDYAGLFQAAAKIANDTKQIELDIDIDGFNEFAAAADELSALFASFTIRLQNVNIINDAKFLRAVLTALEKIYNLSEVFGKFKETIMMTTTIQVPKSAHEARVALESVVNEIHCAMRYINHFVSPDVDAGPEANLSADELNIIHKATDTIDNWSAICDQGISIAMSNDPDIAFITQSSDLLKQTTVNLRSAISSLSGKLNSYMTR